MWSAPTVGLNLIQAMLFTLRNLVQKRHSVDQVRLT